MAYFNGKKILTNVIALGGGGGASLNIEYGLTPPSDTAKLWVQTDTPTSVEIQNYLGECAVSDVFNYCGISNPTTDISNFYGSYFNACYIGNNQIAIVGYNHIRIFDLTTQSYIADYTNSVGTSNYYTNILFKDNVLYFGYEYYLYSFDLSTKTFNTLSTISSSYTIEFIYFNSDNEIDCLGKYYYSSRDRSYHYRYNLITKNCTLIATNSTNYFSLINLYDSNKIHINNTFYNFFYYIDTSNNNQKYHFKYNLLSNTFSDFTSLENFANAQGWTQYRRQSHVYDGERYVYLIGGSIIKSGETDITPLNDIVRYDVINDTFERLGVSLLGAKRNHFSLLIDNRAYIFGGDTKDGFTRPNYMDYFDISYPLNQNNALITTNTLKTNNNLPLINTDALKLNSNISNAYKGNADNKAEKVNIYYYDGTTWKGINCSDYTE